MNSKFRTVATHKHYLALNVEYVHNHIPIEFCKCNPYFHTNKRQSNVPAPTVMSRYFLPKYFLHLVVYFPCLFRP